MPGFLFLQTLLKPPADLLLIRRLLIFPVQDVIFLIPHGFLVRLDILQPFHELGRNLVHRFDPLEKLLKRPVIFIIIGLTFHKDHPAQIVKLRQTGPGKSLIQRLHKSQPLCQRYLQPFRF